MLVIAWRQGPVPRAALAALSLGAALMGNGGAPPPVDEAAPAVTRPIRWTSRAPRAAVANLYGNLPGAVDAPAVTPSMGDTTTVTVVAWQTPRAPRAAFTELYGANDGTLDAPPVVVEAGGPAAPPRPIRWTASRVARALRAATWSLYGNLALEPSSTAPATPSMGDTTTFTLVGWTTPQAPRAARVALYGAFDGTLTTIPPAAEPDTATTPPRPRWAAQRAPAAALGLYRNVAPTDASAPVIVEPEAGGGIARRQVWRQGVPRAVTANLYGNAALEVPLVPGIPQAVSALALGRYRPFRLPRAVLVSLYYVTPGSPEAGSEPEVVIPDLTGPPIVLREVGTVVVLRSRDAPVVLRG